MANDELVKKRIVEADREGTETDFRAENYALIDGPDGSAKLRMDLFGKQSAINILDAKKYEKPETGIPAAHLSEEVQGLLGKADTAVQASDIAGKADKVTNAVNGHFASLDANGNLLDSGSSSSSFATAAQGTLASSAIQGVTVEGTSLTPVNSIVDVTKEALGLNNVTNDAQVKRTEMGQPSGVATLTSEGKVPTAQLPDSIGDDVLFGYYHNGEFYDDTTYSPESQMDHKVGVIYVDQSANELYRWDSTLSEYVVTASSVQAAQSDWAETDSSETSYIRNKPGRFPIIAGNNISITTDVNGMTISATGGGGGGASFLTAHCLLETTGCKKLMDITLPEDAVTSGEFPIVSFTVTFNTKTSATETSSGYGWSGPISVRNYRLHMRWYSTGHNLAARAYYEDYGTSWRTLDIVLRQTDTRVISVYAKSTTNYSTSFDVIVTSVRSGLTGEDLSDSVVTAYDNSELITIANLPGTDVQLVTGYMNGPVTLTSVDNLNTVLSRDYVQTYSWSDWSAPSNRPSGYEPGFMIALPGYGGQEGMQIAFHAGSAMSRYTSNAGSSWSNWASFYTTVNDATLTFKKDAATVATFSANASTDKSVSLGNVLYLSKSADFNLDTSYPPSTCPYDMLVLYNAASSSITVTQTGTSWSLTSGQCSLVVKVSNAWVVANNVMLSAMVGSAYNAAGKAGLVPAPAAGAADRYLCADGTWHDSHYVGIKVGLDELSNDWLDLGSIGPYILSYRYYQESQDSPLVIEYGIALSDGSYGISGIQTTTRTANSTQANSTQVISRIDIISLSTTPQRLGSFVNSEYYDVVDFNIQHRDHTLRIHNIIASDTELDATCLWGYLEYN